VKGTDAQNIFSCMVKIKEKITKRI